MERNFFRLLRSKTQREPGPEADQVFWRKFESQFGHLPEQTRVAKGHLWKGFLAATTAAAAIIVALQFTSAPPKIGPLETELLGSLESYEGLLENFELLQDAQEDDIDFVALSDQDWEILIGEKNES